MKKNWKLNLKSTLAKIKRKDNAQTIFVACVWIAIFVCLFVYGAKHPNEEFKSQGGGWSRAQAAKFY